VHNARCFADTGGLGMTVVTPIPTLQSGVPHDPNPTLPLLRLYAGVGPPPKPQARRETAEAVRELPWCTRAPG